MAVRKTTDAAIAEMTVAQAMEHRRVAIAKGVTREQINSGQETLAIALDAIKLGRGITILPEFIAPAGGCIHILDNIPVVLDQDWQEAINAAGSNTPADHNVRKVGHLYLPTGTSTKNCRLLLLNNAGAGWDKALTWAQQYPQLKPTAPRHVFDIGKHCPQLHYELKCNPMYVVATTECTFRDDQQACYVWWDGSKREACLRWVSVFGHSRGWFAFLCLPDQPGPRASVFSEVSTQ